MRVGFLGYGFRNDAFWFLIWGVRLRHEGLPVQGFRGNKLEGKMCQVSGVECGGRYLRV